MKLKPLHDRIVVQVLEAETKTASGLVIPDNAAEKPTQGRVLAIGNGRTLENGTHVPVSVSVGDTVLFGKFAGQAVKVDGQEVLVMREEDIFAVIEK